MFKKWVKSVVGVQEEKKCYTMKRETNEVADVSSLLKNGGDFNEKQNFARRKKASSTYCLLCLDEAPDMIDREDFCMAQIPFDGNSCCESCLIGLVHSKSNSKAMGTVSALECPLCPKSKNGNRCLVNYTFLRALAKNNAELSSYLDNYEVLASSAGTLQCGSCDSRKSIHLTPTIKDLQSSREALGSHQYDAVIELANSFDCGSLSVEEFYDNITGKVFPTINSMPDRKAWQSIVRHVLHLIQNPERRINFQLRYLRNRPRIWSSCCGKEQCFKCKTSNFHDGKTCAEVCNSYSNEVLSCTQCGVFVVKGDGCDSMKCVCGKRFSFKEVMRLQRSAKQFISDFPNNTAWMCARVMCQTDDACKHDISLANRNVYAQAWSNENPVEYDQALLKWWKTKYPHYTAQCSTLRSPGNVPLAQERARKVYRDLHKAEVMKCEQQLLIAKASMLDTYYPTHSDKARLLKMKEMGHQSLISNEGWCLRSMSSDEVLEKILNPLLQTKQDVKVEESSYQNCLQQFLALFGHLPLRLYEHPTAGILVSTALSNPATGLKYAVGDQVTVAPRYLDVNSNVLNHRSGQIVSCNQDGTFDVELRTTVKIVLHKVHLERLCCGVVRRTWMVPTVAMSTQQILLFKELLDFVKADVVFPPQTGHEETKDNGKEDTTASLRHFLDIALGRDSCTAEDREFGYVTLSSLSGLTWRSLFETFSPCPKSTDKGF